MDAGPALCLVTGALFVVTGGVKVLGVPQSLAIRDHFGMAPRLWRVIGALETCGAVGTVLGIWSSLLGVAATVGLAGLMIGAVASRVRVRDPLLLVLGDLATLALVVTTGAVLATG